MGSTGASSTAQVKLRVTTLTEKIYKKKLFGGVIVLYTAPSPTVDGAHWHKSMLKTVCRWCKWGRRIRRAGFYGVQWVDIFTFFKKSGCKGLSIYVILPKKK